LLSLGFHGASRSRPAVSPTGEASSKQQGDGQRFQKKAMKTTDKNEASAPASVRPSSVSKTGNAEMPDSLKEEARNVTESPTLPGFDAMVKPFKFPAQPYEYKVTALRECPTPETLQVCDTPDKAAEYWRLHIAQNPYFDPERECFAVLLLNTRRRVKGHQIVSIGTHDTLLVHAISVFRLAIMASAPGIVLMHSQPSGDPTPSDADIKVTRDLIRGGQILKIEVIDHVIIGANPNRSSLREMGYFAA